MSVSVCASVRPRECVHACVSVCASVHLCERVHACVCPSVCICTCACLPMSVCDLCLCVRCLLMVWLCVPLRTTQLSTVSCSFFFFFGGGGHRFCLLFNALQYRQTHLTDILSNQPAQGQTRRLQ